MRGQGTVPGSLAGEAGRELPSEPVAELRVHLLHSVAVGGLESERADLCAGLGLAEEAEQPAGLTTDRCNLGEL